MLVLSRKKQESVTITTQTGEYITITVTDINHKQVRIGIKAPNECSIVRNELLQRSYNE